MKVVKGLPAKWGVCSRSVWLDSFIETLSYWNNIVAAGSNSGDIIILDVITGSQTAVLSGHTGAVNCVTFSSDGTSLVSGSSDCTVKLWDVQTGGVVRTFSGHTDWVWSVSISADYSTIASGSKNMIICLWNIQTGECYHTIRQQGTVRHVGFLPINPQHFISICNGKLWEWDTNGHQIKPPFDGSCIAFSSDGTQFVSCHGAIVTIQNSDSGAIITQFQVAENSTEYCCFSPDDRLIAFAVYNTAYVWDITSSNPHLVETLIGHTGGICSLAFSSPSTLISASHDKSIKFWQIGTSSADPVMTDLGSTPVTLPLISSISLQARDGIAISSGADGMVKTWDIPASLCKPSSKTPAKDYKHGDINSRLVFVWYADERINIWNPEKGELLLQADVFKDKLLDLRISGKGSKIFCINEEFIQAWDIWTGGAVGKVGLKGYGGVKLLAMEGSRVWITIPGIVPRAWDFGIPGPSPIDSSTKPLDRLHLSDTKLWDNSLCSIQDTVTGNVVFQLPRGFISHVVEVQWDSQHLSVCFQSKMEFVLKFHPAFLQ